MSDIAVNPASDPVPETKDEIWAVLKRAQDGDRGTLPVLRQLLQRPEILDTYSNLAGQIERDLIGQAVGEKFVFKEALLQRLSVMRSELAGPSPTRLEQLLAERVVTCWLHLHLTELRVVQGTEMMIQYAEYRQKALDRCHRRYLAAVKALAQVRKLTLPVLQVNIGRNQVNVGQAQLTAWQMD